jgi:prepilin-type N-terminal cleavage/methylation domain-containing protein
MTNECAVRGARLRPRGFSLLEMIVVIAILGLVASVTGLAFVSLQAPRESERVRELRMARAEAIRTAYAVVTGGTRAPRTAHVLFLPDGRAIGDGADPITGAPRDSTR